MNENAMVPRKSGRTSADMPLVDPELADQLLAKSQAGWVEPVLIESPEREGTPAGGGGTCGSGGVSVMRRRAGR
jgi:hypothetical protein